MINAFFCRFLRPGRASAHSCGVKGKIVRAVPGLGVLKHDAVGVKGLAGDHGQTVVIIELQIFLIDFSDMLHREFPFAGDDGDAYVVFQIVVYGTGSDFLSELFDHIFAKHVDIRNQRLAVQAANTLNIL